MFKFFSKRHSSDDTNPLPQTPGRRDRGNRRRSGRSRQRRRLLIETLETRLPLAAPTDLAAVAGRIYIDFTGDGFTPGEEVAGAAVNLFRDNGDGNFNAANDSLVSSVTTGADGRYRFDRVVAGNYFVRQPAQTIGGKPLSEKVSPLIRFSADDVLGELFTVIDSFDAAAQLVADDTNDGVPVKSSVRGPVSDIIGGERDLLVNKTSVNGRIQLSVNDPLFPGFLSFDSIQTGQGQRVVLWDGIDGDAEVIRDDGLGGVDLTNGGLATGLRLAAGADSAQGTATIRVYTDDGVAGTASRFSTGVIAIPDTGGEVSSPEFIPFSAFTATGGGGVDFTRVGAIRLEITGAANVNGAANLVGAIGPKVETFDFSNFQSADLSLTMTVNNPSVGVGSNAIFTLTVRNDGPDTASNVAVRAALPAGLTFASATPSSGNYNSATGIWTVGTIPSGGNATLSLVTLVSGAGSITMTAEVSASDQSDPDSTPGNNVPTEDDQASVVITAVAADLALSMTTSNDFVGLNDEVVLTVTVNNLGPSTATNVRISAPVVQDVTLVSTTPSQGTAIGNQWDVGTLVPGGAATLQVRVRMTAFGTRTFTSEVIASDQPDPNSTPGNNNPNENDQASVTVSVVSADLSLVLNVNNTTPNVGQDVAYTITIRNAGPNNATGVTALSRLPIGMAFSSATQNPGGGVAAYDPQSGIWTIGEIAAGSQVELRLVAQPTIAGALRLDAEVRTSDQPDPNSTPGNNVPTEDDQATVTITAQQADLSLAMSVNNANPNRGEQITLTITLFNSGPSTATGIQVRSQLPSGLSFRSAAPTAGTYSNSNGIWSVPSMPNGTSVRLVLTATVQNSTEATVTAEVIAADQPDPDSTPGNGVTTEDDFASITIRTRAADLSLTNQADNLEPNVGEDVRFTIVVSNAGPDTATGVVVGAALPNGLTLVSATPTQGTYSSGDGRWNLGSLNASANATMLLIARVDTRGAKSFTASVLQSDQVDPNSTPGNNVESEDDQETVTVTPPVIDLSLDLTASTTKALVGQPITFTLRLANAGPANASQIAVRAILPEGLTFVSGTTTSGSYSTATSLWTLPSLASGANVTLDLVATFDLPRTFTVTAEVFAVDQYDSNSTPNNNIPSENDQDSVTITPATADLVLTQTVSNATPNFGESTTLTITVRNVGPDTATGVTVKNLLPPELTLVSATPSRGTYSAVTGIWNNLGDIARNASLTLQLVVTPVGVGEITNTAEVQTLDQFDPNSTPGNGVEGENDQVSLIITPQLVDLSLELTINNNKPNVGENVTYQLIVRNAGPSTATGVQIRGVLPPLVAFVSATQTSGNFVPGSGIWTPAPIAAGAAARITIVGRVALPGTGIAVAEVMAADQPDIDSIPGNGNTEEDDFAVVGFVTPVADLSLTIAVDNATPNKNDVVTFTVTIANGGPDAASGIVVTNPLPISLNFGGSNSTAGIYTPSAGTWVILALPAGESATLTYFGKLKNLKTVVNTAEVTRSDQSDPDSVPGNGNPDEDDIATVIVEPAVIDLSVTGRIDNQAPKVGDIVTLTYIIRNSGPTLASGVELQLTLPPGIKEILSFVSQGFLDPITGRWNIGTLANGQTETLTIQLCVLEPGIKRADLEVRSADQFDVDSTPNNGVKTEDDFVSVVINAPRVLSLRQLLAR